MVEDHDSTTGMLASCRIYLGFFEAWIVSRMLGITQYCFSVQESLHFRQDKVYKHFCACLGVPKFVLGMIKDF